MSDPIIIVAFCAWCSVLTILISSKKQNSCNCQTKSFVQEPSGPVLIKNFLKDRFGNIIKTNKRAPKRGDDSAAYNAELKELEKG